jgi:hypothetical protein
VRRWEKDKVGDDAGVTGDPRPASGWLGDAAAFSFGTSGRYIVGAGTPGCTPSFCYSPPPGTYKIDGSFGNQNLSQRSTAAAYKFGTQVRGSAFPPVGQVFFLSVNRCESFDCWRSLAVAHRSTP